MSSDYFLGPRPGAQARVRTWVLVGLLTAVLPACGILDEGGDPRQARLILEGGVGRSLSLVTSNDFAIVSDDAGQTREVYLYTSDTAAVTSPLDGRYSLGSGIRFYASLGSEGALTQAITMRVIIGGKERFSATSLLGETELEFVYTYR